jgi:hypothetical protein
MNQGPRGDSLMTKTEGRKSVHLIQKLEDFLSHIEEVKILNFVWNSYKNILYSNQTQPKTLRVAMH